ncbi:GEVED domain-containing protein [Microbacterium sp.]|uniref:DUF7927 domain-containing protein n=1 Tax=Microbacterium sp. TaxID=51671 RepID=UPI0028112B1A|nr:GEVED domain-containing protein [Microbacterium sp.]
MSSLKSARIAKGRSPRRRVDGGATMRRRLTSGFVTALLVTSTGIAAAAPAAAASAPWAATAQAADSPLARQSAKSAGELALANAPGNPGVPGDPVVLFEEDFENTDGTAPVVLDDYESVDGHTYTAAASWLTACNGVIVNFGIPYTTLGNCGSPVSSANLRQLAYALGVHGGNAAEANDAVSAYTENNPGVNQSEFETVNPIPLTSASGRFLTFSVDAAAKNCAVSPPRYQFSFLSEGGAATPVGGQINACTSGQAVPAPTVGGVGATDISVGTYTSNGSVLFDGSSLGIRMVNANGSGIGNDAAFDNIRILDVTPQLDKSFAPARVPVGGVSTLTLTVTNTSELAAKNGWGFTDELPEGLTVASPSTVGGTCVADVTAAAGSDSIAVANGTLAAGSESCTITVPVTSNTAGAYTNGADNITGESGIDLPATSTVEFFVPPAFTCTSGAGGLLFQYPTGPTLVQNVNMVTGAYETANTIEGRQINAIGYNVLDDYVYGWDLTAGATGIVRVAADGTVTSLGTPTGSVNGSVVGDVDADGQYWVLNGTTWNRIDLEPGSSTYMTVVDSGTSVVPAGLANAGADWAYVPGAGDYLYSVGQSTTGEASLIRFDRATGVRAVVGTLGLGTGTWTFGAVYADANGYLYASNNPTGTIYRIDVGDVSAEVFAQGPASNSNDGARCSASSILLDFGDAPATYGTTLNGDGARHGILGYDEDSHTAPVMLGASIDPEDDGQPSATAVGDDDNAEADEDGVEFNPDLAYAVPTLRTGLDPNSQQPVENTLEVEVSADGFASVWVDWNGDGDFLDEGERVANAQPVTSGSNDITFSRGTNPASIETFVRVRYSTDAESIADPIGAAADGEVEDYRALVTRLIAPDSCVADDTPHYAFTFNSVVSKTGTGGVGSTTRFGEVAVVDGVAVDMVITLVDGRANAGQLPPNGMGSGTIPGIIDRDDAQWQIVNDASFRYEFFEAGTSTPIEVNAVFTVNDLDGIPSNRETATFNASDLAGYAVSKGSLVTITETAGAVTFTGSGRESAEGSRFQFVIEGESSFEVDWHGGNGSGFGFDGDGDYSVQPPACSDFGDAPDSYGTLLESGGAQHEIAPGLTLGSLIDFDANGQPSDDALGDDENRLADEDGVTDDIKVTAGEETAVTVTATNDTAEAATLAGWIDLDGSGTFDAGELASIAVPAETGTAEYELTFPAPTAGGDGFARFRLFPGAVATPLPTGAAAGGEVEDYATTFVQGAPIFLSCSALTTFDEDNGGWRAATTARGTSVVMQPRPVEWSATAGNPGGAIIEDDLDGNWTELWTPPLVASGYATDYSASAGENIQFDYRNDTGVSYDVYVGIVGANGAHYWYNFRDQIVDSTQWTRVIVPLEAAQWHTQFNNNTGPFGAAPSEDDFLAALENVDRFTFSIEGRTGADRTAFDNFGQPCEDFGDAPDTYGTSIANDGSRHQVLGFDEATDSAPLMLGSSIDIEEEGVASPSADADDESGIADEDGVADEIVVTQGDETTVTVSATNTTDAIATLAGWIDLDGNGTFDSGELVTVAVPADSGTAEYELTFPAGTTLKDTFARFRLFPGEVAAPLPTGAAAAGEVEDYAADVIDREMAITKTSDFSADSRPGDTITYTLTAENTGTADYTEADPAVVFDDLAGVLDDAEYNRDATATIDGADAGAVGFVPDTFLSWSGELAAGETVTIEYSVTLRGGGDGTVRNVAWEPNVPPTPGDPPTEVPTCDPATDEGIDPVTGEACASDEGELPKLTVEKAADRTDLPADGEVVTYTITVRNEGPGVFTADAPARVTDDLSEVLDDGAFGEITLPASGASYDEDAAELTWSGPLGVDESAEISYTVIYDANSPDGDQILLNTVCVPAEDALDPDEACDFARVPAAALEMTKTVDPADGTAVEAGQVVTYTLTFENVGQAPATVDALDDLSGVLDDALMTDRPIVDDGLEAQVDGNRLTVTGEVPVGEVRTVSYSVTVNAYDDQADHTLGNVLSNADGSCPPGGCEETENPIRHFSVTKTADVVEDVQTGDTITYTVTVTNDGDAAYTTGQPARVSDDLTDVLDDAAYNGDAIAVASDGSVAPMPDFASPMLTWSGALAVGESMEITYSVTVTNLGDHDLVNVASPVCAQGVPCAPPAEVEILLPSITPSKTSDPASGEALQAGDVVTYTLSWTNDGQAPGPLDSTDDLSGVLDDAEITSAPVADRDDIGLELDADAGTLRVTGELAAGETVTVTYQATIRPDGDRGDNIASNVLASDVPPFECAEGDTECDPFVPPSTTHPLGELDDWKTVDPASGTTVRSGDEMTYTLHFANTGEADVDVARDDVLTMVLDDATVTAAPAASDAALTVSEIVDGRFSVTGTLAAGQEVTVTYTVTVNADGERGDDQLGNFLVGAGEEPPTECAPTDGERPDCTINYVSNVVVSKSADPASGTAIDHDQNVEYTLTFRNVGTNAGAAAVPVDYTDHMAGVLDDAELLLGPIPSDQSVEAVLEGDTIRITGAVATGEVVTVRYIVAPKAYDEQGDHVLGNVLAVTGTDPVCAPDSPLCTTHEITPPPPLATTGAEANWSMLLAALALMLGGGLLAVVSRRRRELV